MKTAKASLSKSAWPVHCTLTRVLGRVGESSVESLGSKHLQTPEWPFYNDLSTDDPLIVHLLKHIGQWYSRLLINIYGTNDDSSAEEGLSICQPARLQNWCSTTESASGFYVLYV